MDWMGIIGCVFLAISIVINVVMVVQDYRKHARTIKEIRKRERVIQVPTADPLNQTPFEQAVLQARNGS